MQKTRDDSGATSTEMTELLYAAWSVISSAYDGAWHKAPDDWRDTATQWHCDFNEIFEPVFKVGDHVRSYGIEGTILHIVGNEAWIDRVPNCTEMWYQHLTVKLSDVVLITSVDDEAGNVEEQRTGAFDEYPTGGSFFQPHGSRITIGDGSKASNTGIKFTGWTPEVGMLVERISDRMCFRLGKTSGGGWTYGRPESDHVVWWEDNTTLAHRYRPRFLQVGDVIESVNADSTCFVVNHAIVSVDSEMFWTDKWNSHRSNGEVICVKGFGPVPWPPKETA